MQLFRNISVRAFLSLTLLATTLGSITACGKIAKPTPSSPPTPIDFALVLQYAQRAALVYESDQVIQQTAGPGTRITISPSTALGVKAFVETDDT